MILTFPIYQMQRTAPRMVFVLVSTSQRRYLAHVVDDASDLEQNEEEPPELLVFNDENLSRL